MVGRGRKGRGRNLFLSTKSTQCFALGCYRMKGAIYKSLIL